MFKLKKLYSENSIFRFMISYAGVLFIPLFVCLMSYQVVFQTVTEELKESNLVMLRKSKNAIDEQMRILNSLMMQTVNNPSILNFADKNIEDTGAFYYNARDIINEFSHVFRYADTKFIGDEFINNVYIYFKNSDYVMTRYTLYKGEFFHNQVLGNKEDLEGWKRRLTRKEDYKSYVVSDEQIDIIQMLPFSMNKPIKGSVVCSINKSAIIDFFKEIKSDSTRLYITDSEGTLLLSIDEQDIEIPKVELGNQKEKVYTERINGEKCIIFNLKSDENNWIYTLVLPEEQVMSKLSVLKRNIFAIFIVAMLSGVCVSYYMANKSGKPIEEIKRNLRGIVDADDTNIRAISSPLTLSRTVEEVVSKTQRLSEELEKQRPYLQAVLFQKLIKGEFVNEQEINYICQSAQTDLSAEAFYIVNVRVFMNNDIYSLDEQTLKEANILGILIKEKLKHLFDEEIFFINIDQLTAAIFIKKEYLHEMSIESYIQKVNEEMIKEHKVKPFWGISDPCTNLLQMWRAFEQAKEALNYAGKDERFNVVEYYSIVEDTTNFYYPLIIEKQLMTYTVEVNYEGIRKLIDILRSENIEKRKLSADTKGKFYQEINSTLLKLIKKDSKTEVVENIYLHINELEQKEDNAYFDALYEVYIEISATYKQGKKRQQDKLIDHMMNYINDVYVNPNLGLGMVAEQFNISEGYVSSLFKEQAGINFTDFVEQKRINKACNLLKETTLSINEISEQVGYNSVQSFRRAFKRIHNVSPSELRKNK